MEIHTKLVCRIMGFKVIESIPCGSNNTGKPIYTIHDQDNEIVGQSYQSAEDAIAILESVQQATVNCWTL